MDKLPKALFGKLLTEFGDAAAPVIRKAIAALGGGATEKAVRAAVRREGYEPIKGLSANPAASALRQAATPPPKPKEKPLAARPSYTRTEAGPYLQVRRENLTPATVPAAREAGSIDELRDILSQPESNIPALTAAAYNQEAFGRGYDLNFPDPGTSFTKQSGIGRVFREAADETPEYKQALFERYGEVMPEVVESAGAQNYDQLTEAAYRQLAEETGAQFDRLPVETRYHSGEGEYPVPSAMLRDILGEGRLNVFRGGDPHPYLSDVDPATGLTSNEMFRAVHDYFGHGTRGATFRPGGEELAYASHSQMMSPLAQMALLSETRGQNSLVNYSPLNAQVIAEQNKIKDALQKQRTRAEMRGERFDPARFTAENARLRELAQEFQYAPQTPVLLPPEYLPASTAGGVPDYVRNVIRPAAPSSPERAVHLSHTGDLTRTDPSFYGTGHRGDDYAMRGRKGSPSEQTSFYLGEEGTVRPEGFVEDVSPFAYETQLSNLYDIESDPEKLIELARAYAIGDPSGTAIPDFKRLVREYGYTGYRAPFGPQYAANVYDPVELRRRISKGPEGYAQGGLVCAA